MTVRSTGSAAAAVPSQLRGGECALGTEPAQRRTKQQHRAVIHQIAVEHPGHFAVHNGHNDHGGQAAVDHTGGDTAAVQTAAERGKSGIASTHR